MRPPLYTNGTPPLEPKIICKMVEGEVEKERARLREGAKSSDVQDRCDANFLSVKVCMRDIDISDLLHVFFSLSMGVFFP